MTESTDVAGWVVLAGSDGLDLDALLSRFGQLHRIPMPAGGHGDEMEPGQPCFFIRTDRSRVIGLWAVGEVVAPTLHLPAGTALLPGEEPLATVDASQARTYAEVELFPLAKPVSLDALLGDEGLAGSELAGGAESGRSPLPLRGREVRAIEAIEFWIDEPTDEQRRALDQLLVADDPILDGLEWAE